MSKGRRNAQSHAARRNLTLARVVVARVDRDFDCLGGFVTELGLGDRAEMG